MAARRRHPLIVRLPRAVVSAALMVAIAACGGRAADGTVAPSPSAASAPSPSAASSPSPAREPVVLWPAPPDPLERAVAAGLTPDVRETLTHHVHAHLDVFVDGQPIVVPAGIGINIDDPGVRRFDGPDGSVGYGGIEGCGQPCISPLHTHGTDGILHTESASPVPNTLGQFFIEWGVTLSETCVGEHCSPEPIAFYVNGEPYSGDPNAIELTDLKEIAIVIGTPPAQIPSTADFSNA